MILPLATEPFAPPTDRDMLPSERRSFVRTHRTGVFGTTRRADGPAMSIVYYVATDSEELLVSTTRDRSKAKAVALHGKASLCVLDEHWPVGYIQVYCDAAVDEDPDLVVDVMMAAAGRMSGEPLDEDTRPRFATLAKRDHRVVLRCRPYATFAQPPRHLHRDDQDEPIKHWVSASMPWDAPDPTEVPT
jgi:hypothetical protein